MKGLHEKYTISAAIKQIMRIEKANLSRIASKSEIDSEHLNRLMCGSGEFTEEDIQKLEKTFTYMRGRIE